MHMHAYTHTHTRITSSNGSSDRSSMWEEIFTYMEKWGAGVETQNNVRGEIGELGRVPFNETYAPSLSTIYDGA